MAEIKTIVIMDVAKMQTDKRIFLWFEFGASIATTSFSAGAYKSEKEFRSIYMIGTSPKGPRIRKCNEIKFCSTSHLSLRSLEWRWRWDQFAPSYSLPTGLTEGHGS